MSKDTPKFLRRSADRYSKLGVRRKKIQRWKKPTGRHNKMRDKKRGYPAVVSIGYKSDEETRTKKEILVKNISDLSKIKKNQIGILGKIGKKNKIEIAKKAIEKNIEFSNFNAKKYLNKNLGEKK